MVLVFIRCCRLDFFTDNLKFVNLSNYYFMSLFSSFYGCFLANLATSSKQKDHKHEKPMYLKDYQRKIVLEKDG